MTEDIKKTAEAYETVSEEKAIKDTKNTEETTEKMIEKTNAEEVKADNAEKEVAHAEVAKKDQKFSPRGRKRFQRPDDREVVIETWVPKTKLGKEVKAGKIKNIDEILEKGLKILESEAVDYLMPLTTDLIAQGQSKGKFGGGKRRAWRQTQRITREGGVVSFSAMAVIGDENGHVGIGVGKAGETLPSRDKATRKAKKDIMKITRGCASFDCDCSLPHTVPFEVTGKSGSVIVKLMPAPQGTGLVVAKELQKVLKLAGIQDIYSRVAGQSRTTFNLVKACMKALQETNRK